MLRTALFSLSLLVAPVAALAAEPAGAETVDVQVHPSPVPIDAGGSAVVVFTARNDGALALRNLTLLFPGGDPDDEGSALASLEPGATGHWSVTLRRAEDAPPGKRPWLLRYTAVQGSRETPGASAGSLEIVEPPERPQRVSATVTSKLGVLEDVREAGLAFVEVENLTDRTLRLTGVKVHAPYFVRVAPVAADAGERPCGGFRTRDEKAPAPFATRHLPPRSSLLLPYSLVACRAIEPGEHMVVWEIEVGEEHGDAPSRSVLARHEFKAQVLGESALLQAVKVPSLLLLPGALVLLTWGFLRHRRDLEAKRLGPAQAEFWLLAVFLSIIAAFVYPLLTNRLGDPRDYLVAYGIYDIFHLWGGSMVVAAVAYALWWSGRWALAGAARKWEEGKARRALRREQRNPQPGDPPLTVLRKLAAAGRVSLRLQQVEVAGLGIALVLDDADEPLPLLAPPIVVECSTPECQETLTPLLEGAAEPLLAAIEAEQARGGVTRVQWDPDSPLRAPEQRDPGAGWRERSAQVARLLVEIRS